jgi:alpha-amylase
VRLHDYSGSNRDDVTTDSQGRLTVAVPAMSYAIFGPAGIGGGFDPPKRRTTQEFQLDDDLGDSRASALGYGGRIRPAEFRTAGAIWAAAGTPVKVEVFTDGARQVEVRVFEPDQTGAKSTTSGQHDASGPTSNTTPLTLQFTAAREGYHQLSARLTEADETPTRAYVKAEYEAPAASDKF